MRSAGIPAATLTPPETVCFSSAQAAADALAEEAACALRRALDMRETVSLVVPGGRSAAMCLPPLFDHLLEWGRVRILLTDERWVPPSSPESNEALVRGMMVKRPAQQAELTGFWQAGLSAAMASRAAAEKIKDVPRPFDLVICGMGDDGHVASIFPGASSDNESANDTVTVSRAPAPPHQRVTLAMGALSTNRDLFLLITGATKQAIVRNPADNLPVSRLLRRSEGRCKLFLDGLGGC